MIDTDKLHTDALAELLRISGTEYRLKLEPAMLIVIVAQVQLALRHPQNAGTSSKAARSFISAAREFFVAHNCHANAALIDLGFDPDYDERPGGE
jgi:hypothetical protein